MIRMRLCWVLLAIAALAACATAPNIQSEGAGCEEAAEAVSFEEACADDSSLLALCAGERCGLYRCREVMQHLTAGRVVRTWAEVAPLPEVQGGAQRYWGSAQEFPWDSRPVLIIPWDVKPPLLPSQQKQLDDAAKERSKPREKHHIFPRAFREWFTRQGIDIDEYVILLEVQKHRSIHRGERGGPWNEAWRTFIEKNLKGAPKEQIFRYAGQLIYEFELFGPVVPYWKQPPPLSSGY
jgi:uncharacterized lipoprotein (TIGR02269 family)